MSALSIACPRCGESERLRGTNADGVITVTCEACGHWWIRDPDVCPSCKRRSMTDRRDPLMQKARGTQQSIIGYHVVSECSLCGFRAS